MMNEETRVRLAQLEQQRAEASAAGTAAIADRDYSSAIEAFKRASAADDAITRLTNPASWQARQLIDAWPPDQAKVFVSWLSGYSPDMILLFELSRRDLPMPWQRQKED